MAFFLIISSGIISAQEPAKPVKYELNKIKTLNQLTESEINAWGILKYVKEGKPLISNQYNELNWLNAQVDNMGRKTLFDYNNAGEIKAVIDPLNNKTVIHRSSSGLYVGRTRADGVRDITVTYDFGAAVSSTKDGEGNTIYRNSRNGGRYKNMTLNNKEDLLREISKTDKFARPLLVIEYNDIATSDDDVRIEYEYVPHCSSIQSETFKIRDHEFKVIYNYKYSLPDSVIYPSHSDNTSKILKNVFNKGELQKVLFNYKDETSSTPIAEYKYNGCYIGSESLGDNLLNTEYMFDFRSHLVGLRTKVKNELFRDVRFVRKKDGRIQEIKYLLHPESSITYKYGDDGYGYQEGYRLRFVSDGRNGIENYEYDKMGNIRNKAVLKSKLMYKNTDGFKKSLKLTKVGDWKLNKKDLVCKSSGFSVIQMMNRSSFVTKGLFQVDFASVAGSEPADVQFYFGSKDIGNERYIGVRTRKEDNALTPDGKPGQMYLVEVGENIDGESHTYDAQQVFMEPHKKVVKFKFSIDYSKLTIPLILDWSIDGTGGKFEIELNGVNAGMSGFSVVQKKQNSIKIRNVFFEGCLVAYENQGLNEVYQCSKSLNKSCTWDKNGNLTRYGESVFKYDPFNRLIQANGTKYLYDYKNRLIAKADSVSGKLKYIYVYKGNELIAEYNGEGGLLREYISGICSEGPICLIDYTGIDGSKSSKGDRYYYLKNHNSDAQMLIGEDGIVFETYSYSAYGQHVSFMVKGEKSEKSRLGNMFLFKGAQRDPETGLIRLKGRLYFPEMARYITMDPAFPQSSCNYYEAFKCDPVNNN